MCLVLAALRVVPGGSFVACDYFLILPQSPAEEVLPVPCLVVATASTGCSRGAKEII